MRSVRMSLLALGILLAAAWGYRLGELLPRGGGQPGSEPEPDTVLAEGPFPTDKRLAVRLVLSKSNFEGGEPIRVDVFVRNLTQRDIQHPEFHRYSSIVGVPTFRFSADGSSEEFALSPGWTSEWYGWPRWTAADPESPSAGQVTIPAGPEVHLLAGDLRALVSQSRKECGRLLDGRLWEGPAHAATLAHYRRVEAFCTRFLRDGGAYHVRMRAYGMSDAVPFAVAPALPGMQ
jgi:hypothetical protein